MFPHLITAPQVWIQFSFILAKYYIILNLSPHPILLHFCFACFSIRLLSFSSNFTLTRVGPNILFVYSLANNHFEFCFEQMNPRFTTSCLALGSNFPTFPPRQPQVSHFLYYSLVDQLYEKEVYFYSFVTKSNQASNKYSPDVFSSFYRIVKHGESHRIFTSPPSNSVSPCFTKHPL